MAGVYEKHLAAIKAGNVTKSNVIGIRKAINAGERRYSGLSVSATAPRVAPWQASELESALTDYEPRVSGELHDSGLAILRNPRWRKRFSERQHEIISRLDHFRLVRFDRIGAHDQASVPVYRVCDGEGNSFDFRNVPWQSADAYGEESGPVVV